MSNLTNLSKRLQLIASFVPKGAYFADIGSDHAYLPSYVCLNDKEAKAIAGEVNVGPFNRATQVVKENDLSNVIHVKLGDGLDVIKNEPINCVIIAGMGGSLITSILERGKQFLQHVNRLILQPNIDERSVRVWLLENNYHLITEEIVYENGHYYEILVAEKNENGSLIYDQEKIQKQLLFGPYLLEQKSDLFLQKWQELYNKTKRTINNMKKAKQLNEEKIAQFEKELKWIEEVLELNG